MMRQEGGRLRKGLLLCLGLIVLFASLSLLASPQAEWKGTVVKEGDVTVVKNPREPLSKTPILELKEDLSIGGPDAQGDDVFSQARQVVADDAGTMYVLDEQASDVKVFDASGKYLRTIGRKGQGPGELEFPMTLSLNRAAGELTSNSKREAWPSSRRTGRSSAGSPSKA